MKRYFIIAVLCIFVNANSATAVTNDPTLNRHEWLTTYETGVSGVHAHIAAGAMGVGQCAFVSRGGTEFLDIIQIGVKRVSTTSWRIFAAWGRGIPNGPNSLYIEQDLGPTDTASHTYTLRLSGRNWYLYANGVLKLTVPDTFRTWAIQNSKVVNETETGENLGGTVTYPVKITKARVYRSGAWRLPNEGWSEGGWKVPSNTRITMGEDWLTIWRI
jgi:hypothetical protein